MKKRQNLSGASGKVVATYFANWHLDTKTARQGSEVCSIPWDKVTTVNHAFWVAEPADGSMETSFERRAAGLPPRKKFRVASMTPEADFGYPQPSALEPALPRGHFAQYAVFAQRYPQVKILISIGGWIRCGYFSEMAYTSEGRASFIDSCMALLKAHSWLDGFDIDWEYFGGDRGGERLPGGGDDQGCPVWGTAREDCENFASLARELRAAMDKVYGPGVKKLTACASGSCDGAMGFQNWRLAEPYLDMVNIMTYDLAGPWDGVTGHASSPSDSAKAARTLMELYGVPPEKVCIGTPFYAKIFQMTAAGLPPVGASCKPDFSDLEIDQEKLRRLEAEAVSGYTLTWQDGRPGMGARFSKGGRGWHFAAEEKDPAPYLYNDDENSPFYRWFLSYENPLSLQKKLDDINASGIAGMIIWECSEDTPDHAMTEQIAANLLTE